MHTCLTSLVPCPLTSIQVLLQRQPQHRRRYRLPEVCTPFQLLLRGNPLPSTKTNPSHQPPLRRRPRHVISNTYLLRVVTRIRPTRPDTSTPLPTPTRPLRPRPSPPDSSREAFGARIHLSPQHFRLRPSGHPHHPISHPFNSTAPNSKANSRTSVPARLHLQPAEHTSPHPSTTFLPSPRPLLHLLTHWQPGLTRARRCLKSPDTFPTRPINIFLTLTPKPPLTPLPVLTPSYLLSHRPDPHSAAYHPSTSPHLSSSNTLDPLRHTCTCTLTPPSPHPPCPTSWQRERPWPPILAMPSPTPRAPRRRSAPAGAGGPVEQAGQRAMGGRWSIRTTASVRRRRSS